MYVRSVLLWSSVIGITGMAMFCNSVLLNGVAKDALIIAGSILSVLALSVIVFPLIATRKTDDLKSEELALTELLLCAGFTLALSSIPSLCLGYGAVHIGITSLFQEAGIDIAATIAAKCVISGVIGFGLGYICAFIYNKKASLKEKFFDVKGNLICAVSVGFGAMAATVFPEVIADAIGAHGDVRIAFEVLMAASVMLVTISAFYGGFIFGKAKLEHLNINEVKK